LCEYVAVADSVSQLYADCDAVVADVTAAEFNLVNPNNAAAVEGIMSL
jgi:hypothetical protein